MPREVNNNEDILDSRDVIKRLEELRDERAALVDAMETEGLVSDRDALKDWDESLEADELKALEALAEQAAGYAPDWEHGETLIRDSYFKEYAMELAEDIGAIDRNASWPNTCIDWDQAARELQMDYTAVDFDGVTYWIR